MNGSHETRQVFSIGRSPSKNTPAGCHTKTPLVIREESQLMLTKKTARAVEGEAIVIQTMDRYNDRLRRSLWRPIGPDRKNQAILGSKMGSLQRAFGLLGRIRHWRRLAPPEPYEQDKH